MRADGRPFVEELLGSLAPARAGRRAALAPYERRVEVLDHAHRPSGRVGGAAAWANRIQLRRRAVLVTLSERVARGIEQLLEDLIVGSEFELGR